MRPYRPVRAVATFMMTFMMSLLILALIPATVSADLNGSLYVAQGGAVPVFFNFSASGTTYVVIILTYGNGGNGRWFAAFGATDGVSGTCPLIVPTSFTLTQPPGGSLHFVLDPGGATGSFTINGLQGLLSITSGRMIRVFP